MNVGSSDVAHDSLPVIRLEWRKIRREESRGLTSHSWLEAYLSDESRLKLETFSNTGYRESFLGNSDELEGTLYDGRAAEPQDFLCALTAKSLRKIAKEAGDKQPYSLSEFNCHHFVLDVWNTVTVDRMQATHFPDRAKLGILWGLEGTVGTWLGRVQSLGAPPRQEDSCGRERRLCRGAPCHASEYNATLRHRFFKDALENGLVFLVEPNSQGLVPTEPPLPSMGTGIVEAWANMYLDGLGLPAVRLCERIGPIELTGVVSQLGQAKATAQKSKTSQFSFFGSFASTSLSTETVSSESIHPHDVCFVVLRSKDLRLVTYSVLKSTTQPPITTCLRLLSGDAFGGQDAAFGYSHCELPDAQTMAFDLAHEEFANMQLAVRTGDYETFLGGWRNIGNRQQVV